MIYFRVTIIFGNPRLLETATIAGYNGKHCGRTRKNTETILRIIFQETVNRLACYTQWVNFRRAFVPLRLFCAGSDTKILHLEIIKLWNVLWREGETLGDAHCYSEKEPDGSSVIEELDGNTRN